MPEPHDANALPPIACTLDADAVDGRLVEWAAMLAHVQRRIDLAGGMRLEFGSNAPVEDLARLAVAEHSCCSFLSFGLTIDGRGVGLEVSAPADARPLLEQLFGATA